MKAAVYVRVSTNDQTCENQLLKLTEVASLRGWDIVHVYEDKGISGAKGRKDRPGLDAMLTDAAEKKFDVLMAWSIDRVGRSLSDLLFTMDLLHGVDVDLYFHQSQIDTTTPTGKLMFQIVGAMAEFERSMIRERVKAGLERTRANGTILGRPKVGNDREAMVRDLLKTNGICRTAFLADVGTSVVQRVKKEMAVAR